MDDFNFDVSKSKHLPVSGFFNFEGVDSSASIGTHNNWNSELSVSWEVVGVIVSKHDIL